MMEDEFVPLSLADQVIGSVDTLRGTELDLHIPDEWNDRPPVLLKRFGISSNDMDRLLKGMIRQGIPPALRCAVWLSNIMQAVHPHQDASYWHEYRTLAKVMALDNAYECVLQQILDGGGSGQQQQQQQQQDQQQQQQQQKNNEFASCRRTGSQEGETKKTTSPQKNSPKKNTDHLWKSMEASTYGRNADAEEIDNITTEGMLARKRVLMALERILGMEFAPLIPSLTSVLLTSMSESYAFCAIREMGHQSSSWYFPTARIEHSAWCCAFGDILRKLHKSTAEYLEDRGVLDVPEGLAPIFQDFWVGVLPLQYVQRILDIYTLEGSKVLFRFGVALLVLYKRESSEQKITISNANEWWHTMKNWAYSKRFNFELVVRKAYGVHGRGMRKQMRFPRRTIIQRIIRMEQDRLREQGMDDDYEDAPARPLGLIHRTNPDPLSNDTVKPILAESHSVRLHLAEWLPMTLRLSNLDLLYSTSYHGRSLEMFYRLVKDAKCTLLLCEVLRDNCDQNCVIGMFASQAWRVSTKIYGDGGCFLFRLQPNAKCWKWQPGALTTGGSYLDHVDLEDDGSNNQIALMEQFMVGTNSYISIGGNEDGSAGLRINEDLTRGESSPATGFDNEPLHGLNKGSVFEIGLVEVYGLVRQIDGRAV